MTANRRARPRVQDDFDGAWKNMLSERRFASFVGFFMPEVFDQIDWKRGVEFLEQELRAITRKTRRGLRSVDRLVKVWLTSGLESWCWFTWRCSLSRTPTSRFVCSSTAIASSIALASGR
jgi:hypothetical protein